MPTTATPTAPTAPAPAPAPNHPAVFNFVTLFPELVAPYFAASILARARADGLIATRFFNPRERSAHPHRKVDDYMIGGGAGLVLHPQPLFDTLEPLANSHIIVLAPAAKPFRQIDARRLAKIAAERELTFVCGRYEGIDERVIERYASELFSIGDFVLTGGELPALCLADAIARNLPGVINAASLGEESFEGALLEAPAFARPAVYEHDFCGKTEKFCAILPFVKGNHARITAFKNQLSLCKTKFHRPDLLAAHHYLRKKNEK